MERKTVVIEVEPWAWPDAKDQLLQITGISSVTFDPKLDQFNEGKKDGDL